MQNTEPYKAYFRVVKGPAPEQTLEQMRINDDIRAGLAMPVQVDETGKEIDFTCPK